jgi:pterin-4a-carbinolamine dehydratase
VNATAALLHCLLHAAAAVKFFNQVAEVAEAEGHHPDLHLTNYREVQVGLMLRNAAIGNIAQHSCNTCRAAIAVHRPPRCW